MINTLKNVKFSKLSDLIASSIESTRVSKERPTTGTPIKILVRSGFGRNSGVLKSNSRGTWAGSLLLRRWSVNGDS